VGFAHAMKLTKNCKKILSFDHALGFVAAVDTGMPFQCMWLQMYTRKDERWDAIDNCTDASSHGYILSSFCRHCSTSCFVPFCKNALGSMHSPYYCNSCSTFGGVKNFASSKQTDS
jgi:hypothetical protein